MTTRNEISRRESLKLLVGMLFAPLLRWFPKEKVIVKPSQNNREELIAILRLLPTGMVNLMRSILQKNAIAEQNKNWEIHVSRIDEVLNPDRPRWDAECIFCRNYYRKNLPEYIEVGCIIGGKLFWKEIDSGYSLAASWPRRHCNHYNGSPNNALALNSLAEGIDVVWE